MQENIGSWETSVSADLIPAIEHLRKSFGEALGGCAHVTGAMCYVLLHDEPVDAQSAGYTKDLFPILEKAGKAAHRRFNLSIQADTLSASFKGYFDLYLAFASTQALSIMREFTEIGRVHQNRLGVSYLEWANDQIK
jgi:hypothetical protein